MKNTKKVFLLFVFILLSGWVNAQAFSDGKNLVMFGFGFPATSKIKNDFNDYKKFIDYKFNNYGTLHLKYEHGLHEHFGLGLNVEYSAASLTYKYDDSNLLRYQVNIKSKVMGIYGRFNGHLPIGDDFDIYAGVGLGYSYKIDHYDDNNPNSTSSHKTSVFEFDYQLTLGLRYMVKPGFGLFGEVGIASTTGQLGVALAF